MTILDASQNGDFLCISKILMLLFIHLFDLLLSKETHVFIGSKKHESFVHNAKETYYLDRNETMTVWAKIVPFPWQDNRLVPGVSDPEMLEFNMSCIEEVVMPGVVSRNLTVDIAQVQRKEKNSTSNYKTGNAILRIEVFEMTNHEPLLYMETHVVVGCPPTRILTVQRSTEQNCPSFEKYEIIIPSRHYRTRFTTPIIYGAASKILPYDFKTLGCPILANYYELFKPKLQIYDNGLMLRNMTSSYVLLELNGRTDYTYYASMAEAGCLRKAQTYQLMIDDNLNKSNLSLVWTSMNYESCFAFDDLENANLEERYEILNESGVSSIVWQSEGVFVFLATVIDPEYSFCNLSTMFAVYVTGLEKERKRLIPFLVLGTSVFGLFGVLFLLYVTTK